MPGIMGTRNLAAAAAAARKKGLDDFPGAAFGNQKLPKSGKFVLAAQEQQLQFAQLRHHTRSRKSILDLDQRRLFDRNASGAAAAADGSQSSGSEHEPSSVSLAAMVDEFLEDQATLEHHGGFCKPSRSDRSPDDASANLGGELLEILKGFIACESDEERALLADASKAIDAVKEQAATICKQDGPDCAAGCLKRAAMRHLRSAGYNAAICKSRWDHRAGGGFSGGDYEYIDVLLEGQGPLQPQRLIVDVDFREQFVIARPTERYASILDEVPVVFVGKPERLQQVVNVMCDAVKQSLKKRGMALPPWRKPEYLRAKWFSAYRRTSGDGQPHEDVDVAARRALSHTAFRGPRLDPKFTNVIEEATNTAATTTATAAVAVKCVPEFQFPQMAVALQQREEMAVAHRDEMITAMASEWKPPEIKRAAPVGLAATTLSTLMRQQRLQELNNGRNLVLAAVS